MSRFTFLSAIALLVVGGFATTANAATCAFGSLVGSTCTVDGGQFDVVYDINAVGLYGDAQILGGSQVQFFPTIIARSQDTEGQDQVTEQAVFDLIADDPGMRFSQVDILEVGLYIRAQAESTVDHDGSISIEDVVTSDEYSSQIVSTAFDVTPGAGSLFWQATGGVLVNGSNPNHVQVTINNILTATSSGQIGGLAEISKSGSGSNVQLEIDMTPVPVPAAVWLFGSALGLLGWMRRRQQ